MAKEKERKIPRHPIRVVARRTGIAPDVLRAWERRYEVVAPERAKAKRRLYSDDDIERLVLLKRAVDGGRRISDVAGLSPVKLRALLEEDAVCTSPRAPRERGGSESAPDLLAESLDAVEAMDDRKLREVLARAAVELSRPRLRSELLVPLLHAIGERWSHGSVRIAQEHLAVGVLREFVAGLVPSRATPATAPLLVSATLPGQLHELGALLVVSLAGDQGWRVAYLGPQLPAEEIAVAARRMKARAVAVSLVYPINDGQTPPELRRLRNYLGADIAILAGGGGAASYAAVLKDIGAVIIEDLDELPDRLAAIARSPHGAP